MSSNSSNTAIGLEEQFLAIGLFYGSISQIAAVGLATTLSRNWGKMMPIHYIMALVNLFCAVYPIASALWMFYDLAKSGGAYDPLGPVGFQCTYYQFPLTGFVYNLSDLVIDVYCSLTCLYFCWPALFVSYGQTAQVIVKENILRSICIVIINSYFIYFGTTNGSPSNTDIGLEEQCLAFGIFYSYITQISAAGLVTTLRHYWGKMMPIGAGQHIFSSAIIGLEEQFLAFGIFYGSITQIAAAGLATTLQHYWGKMMPIHYIMVLVNLFCAAYQITSACSFIWWQGEADCYWGLVVVNVASHLFYISLDCFLMYKTWIVSGYRDVVRYGAGVLLANRLVWMFYDLVESGCTCPDGECSYYQFPLTGFMYNLSDLIIDVACSLTCLYFCWSSLFVSYGQIARIIVKENVLRSVCIVIINSYIMYYGTTNVTAFTYDFLFWLQAFVYCVACNSEFFWKAERSKDSTKHEVVRANLESGNRESAGNRTFKRDSLSAGGKSVGGGGGRDSIISDIRSKSVGLDSRRLSGFK
ncbi:hypothetical protein HDU98_004728 [Podochytrium sp. JEL0797]|nr:hypothetical protein HDU98_004728 [Podochytrium sp. JEL0797]